MGCFPGKPSSKNTRSSKIIEVNDIKIDHGTFIHSNEKSFNEVYVLGKVVSNRSYGEIRQATHRETKSERTVKIFRKDISSYKGKEKYQQEIQMLKQIDHPNIIKIFEFFEDTKKLFIVIEYCKGGELFEQILNRQFFNEIDTCKIMKQLFSAVAYIHSINIIHRDLKPENILLEEQDDSFNIKLIDFSAATYYTENNALKGVSGSPYYIAPEMISGEYDEKCDMWSCGVIVYILLCGYPPFDGTKTEEIIEKIKIGKYSLNEAHWSDVSDQAKDLISKLICSKEARLTAKQALKHPWFKRLIQIQPAAETFRSALSNLRSFHNSNKLRDAVHTFITTQCISSLEIKELREVFRAIDLNGDGKLSREELLKHYEIYMGSFNAQEEVAKIMSEVDTDNNGFIDYTEFLKASLNSRVIMSSENLRRAFDLFDTDSNGSISAAELKKVLGNENIDDNVWDQLIKSIDQNSDKEIDLREFEEVILKSK